MHTCIKWGWGGEGFGFCHANSLTRKPNVPVTVKDDPFTKVTPVMVAPPLMTRPSFPVSSPSTVRKPCWVICRNGRH